MLASAASSADIQFGAPKVIDGGIFLRSSLNSKVASFLSELGDLRSDHQGHPRPKSWLYSFWTFEGQSLLYTSHPRESILHHGVDRQDYMGVLCSHNSYRRARLYFCLLFHIIKSHNSYHISTSTWTILYWALRIVIHTEFKNYNSYQIVMSTVLIHTIF